MLLPGPGTKPIVERTDTGDDESFRKDLLAKFPAFDPAWPDELKALWFKDFQQFMEMASKGHVC